jgi:hypothetical protein
MRLSPGQYPRTYFFALHLSPCAQERPVYLTALATFSIVKLSLSPTSTLATRAQSNNPALEPTWARPKSSADKCL